MVTLCELTASSHELGKNYVITIEACIDKGNSRRSCMTTSQLWRSTNMNNMTNYIALD